MNNLEMLNLLSESYEDLEMFEENFLSNEDRKFIDDIYSFPYINEGMNSLEKLRISYLKEYMENSDKIEELIPFNDFVLFFNEAKDIKNFTENNVDIENTEENLIENGFYKSEFVIHAHNAKTFHWDLRWKTRFGNSAYSFAIPKAKIPEDNEKILALKQPMHPSIWVDLKTTDTFKDDTQSGSMGSISLVDKGYIFVKERPKSYAIYIQGETIRGSYILISSGNNNSYIFIKTDNIMSDSDARNKEWKISAYKYWKYQKEKILEMFKINCEETKLIFENEDGSIDYNEGDEEMTKTASYKFIFIPSHNSKTIKERMEANPERIAEQCQADTIGYRLGLYIWNCILDEESQNKAYEELKKLGFTTNYMNLIDNFMKPTLFSEAISCILTGRKMFGRTHLGLILQPIISKDKKNYEKIEIKEEKDENKSDEENIQNNNEETSETKLEENYMEITFRVPK